MTSCQPAGWHDLYVASAGAATALTGLIFVAVSINLAQILADRRLPIRAAETLSILVGLLLLSVFMLVPGQARGVLGGEITALGVLLGAALLWKRIRLPRQAGGPRAWSLVPLRGPRRRPRRCAPGTGIGRVIQRVITRSAVSSA